MSDMNNPELTQEEKEEKREEILENEPDILSGLLEAHKNKEERTAKIEIAREGKTYFAFSVRGMDDSQQENIRKKHTKKKGKGRNQVSEFDPVGFTNEFIYKATTEEDRKKIWDNKTAWDRLNALSGPGLIGQVLTAGEKDAIAEKITVLSGFEDQDDENEEEETVYDQAKN